MEGKSRLPEMTIPPAPRPEVDGGAVDAASKAAGKEPISPGTPSSAAAVRSGKESNVPLPGWKLDALCQEHGPSPARARFLYF